MVYILECLLLVDSHIKIQNIIERLIVHANTLDCESNWKQDYDYDESSKSCKHYFFSSWLDDPRSIQNLQQYILYVKKLPNVGISTLVENDIYYNILYSVNQLNNRLIGQTKKPRSYSTNDIFLLKTINQNKFKKKQLISDNFPKSYKEYLKILQTQEKEEIKQKISILAEKYLIPDLVEHEISQYLL